MKRALSLSMSLLVAWGCTAAMRNSDLQPPPGRNAALVDSDRTVCAEGSGLSAGQMAAFSAVNALGIATSVVFGTGVFLYPIPNDRPYRDCLEALGYRAQPIEAFAQPPTP